MKAIDRVPLSGAVTIELAPARSVRR